MKEHSYFSQGRKRWARIAAAALFAVGLCLTGLSAAGWAQGQDDNDEGSRLKAIVHAEQLPGNVLTVDGNAVHLPSAQDHFPELQTNTIGFPVSLGTFNAHQQSDVHAYWEFNHGTDWTFPAYELVATGGIARTSSDGLPNTRLDLPATVFDRQRRLVGSALCSWSARLRSSRPARPGNAGGSGVCRIRLGSPVVAHARVSAWTGWLDKNSSGHPVHPW